MTLLVEHYILLLGLTIAVITDLKYELIPNKLNGPLILAGFLVHAGKSQLMFSVAGFAIAFIVHFLLWQLRVERGGDAKLMIAVGALLGAANVMEATAWYAAVYLVVAPVILLMRGRLGNLWKVTKTLAQKGVGTKGEEEIETTKLKTAPIIAVAVVIGYLTDYLYPAALDFFNTAG